jgi:hypothetical protein
VNIHPATFGGKSALLSVSTDDPNNPTVSVKLAATAVPPTISASPLSLDFGKVKTGTNTATKVVTIKNTGLSDLKIDTISLSGDSSFDQTNTCSTIAKGASCTVSVTISPATFGIKTGTLNIPSNDPKKPVLSVKLKGTASPPSVSISPTNIVFRSVATGATSAEKKITIKNIGVSDLNITSVAVEGVSSPFAQTNSCGVIVKGGSCTVTVTFAPVSTGSMIDTIDIVSDDPAKGTVKVKLSGKGK